MKKHDKIMKKHNAHVSDLCVDSDSTLYVFFTAFNYCELMLTHYRRDT